MRSFDLLKEIFGEACSCEPSQERRGHDASQALEKENKYPEPAAVAIANMQAQNRGHAHLSVCGPGRCCLIPHVDIKSSRFLMCGLCFPKSCSMDATGKQLLTGADCRAGLYCPFFSPVVGVEANIVGLKPNAAAVVPVRKVGVRRQNVQQDNIAATRFRGRQVLL